VGGGPVPAVQRRPVPAHRRERPVRRSGRTTGGPVRPRVVVDRREGHVRAGLAAPPPRPPRPALLA